MLNLIKKKFIFLDFDGTITQSDVIMTIMEAFGPAGWTKLKDQVLARQISIRQGVGEMFSLIPSHEKERIIQFVKDNVKIRKGFPDFLDFCNKEQMEYKIVSGGLDFFVYPLLERWISTENILCNSADFSGQTIGVEWGYPCDPYCHLDCGLCKVSLIRTYDPSYYCRILIGDSITDYGAASIADKVFATDYLLRLCRESDIPVIPFENFYEVKDALKN